MFIQADEAVRSNSSGSSSTPITYRSGVAMLSMRSRSGDDSDRAPRVRGEACVCIVPAARHRAAGGRATERGATARRGSAVAAPHRADGETNSCGPCAHHGEQGHRNILDAPGRSRTLVVEGILELGVGCRSDALQFLVVLLASFGVRKHGVRLVNHADHLLVGISIQALLYRLISGLYSCRGRAGRQVQEVVVGIVHGTILGCVCGLVDSPWTIQCNMHAIALGSHPTAM